MKSSAGTAAEPLGRGAGALAVRQGLAGARGVILAVSGGPDSTALMVLVAEWAERPPVLVVTVDHGLRPEAADEAAQVAANAARLGLPSRIMRPATITGTGNLQARAREARYLLLEAAARVAGFDTIATAHHLDDQAETFLLRMARGSGVYGLGAMRPEAAIGDLRLVRPFLHVPRAVLARIARESGLPLADDPSNLDLRYDRARLRRLMPALAEQGLTAERLADTAARLARAADALDSAGKEVLRAHYRADPFGVVRGPAAPLFTAHPEVGLRILSRLLQAAAGAPYPPRLDRLEALYAALAAVPPAEGLTRTLHGAVLRAERGILTIRREWGRRGLPAIPGEAGSTLVWDGRFAVTLPEGGETLTVAPLARADRPLRSRSAPAAVWRALPGLYRGAHLIAVPAEVEPRGPERPFGRVAAECLVPRRLGIEAEKLTTSGYAH